MRVIHLAGADTFHDPDSGASYKAGPDGVFEMPEHVGAHYTTKHAGMFRRESDHEALIAAAKAETLRDPRNTSGTLQALLERMTAVEAKVAQWEEWFGTPPADGTDTVEQAPADDDGAEAGGPEEPETDAAAEDSDGDADDAQ